MNEKKHESLVDLRQWNAHVMIGHARVQTLKCAVYVGSESYKSMNDRYNPVIESPYVAVILSN